MTLLTETKYMKSTYVMRPTTHVTCLNITMIMSKLTFPTTLLLCGARSTFEEYISCVNKRILSVVATSRSTSSSPLYQHQLGGVRI